MPETEVSRDAFYAAMGPLNVHPCPIGSWPYETHWKLPSGKIIGRTVPGESVRYFIARESV